MQATPRTKRAYKTHHVTRITAEVECLNCGAMHTVDRCEDGPDVDFVPCQGSDTCKAMLCPDCRHGCDFCGLFACEEHISSEKICHTCQYEGVELDQAWLGGDAA